MNSLRLRRLPDGVRQASFEAIHFMDPLLVKDRTQAMGSIATDCREINGFTGEYMQAV